MSSGPGTFDVIVVGGGGAGLATTIEAAGAGCRVLLLEKSNRLGGMLHIANGEMSGANTRRQRERGIDDDPRRHFEDVRTIAHDRCDPALAWRSVRSQGDTIDWLEDLGLEFDPDCPGLIHGHEVYAIPRTYWGVNYGRSVLEVLARRVHELQASGLVRIVLNARVHRLVSQEPRSVSGVAWSAGRAEDRVETVARSPAIVLATGGYDADKQLRDEFLPSGCADALIGCLEHATGDGLRVAVDAGASVTRRGYFIPVMGLLPDPDRPGFAVDYRVASVQLPPEYRTPHEIWVNADGRRFVAEDTPSPERRERALLAQRGLAMYVVWDRLAAERGEPLLTNTAGEWSRARMDAEVSSGRWIKRADSLAELAHTIGMDPVALESTVARYNGFVGQGYDEDFGRRALPHELSEPPFYCLTSVAASILSRDGLSVDSDSLSVLDKNGLPISGLHAVGEVLGNNVFAGDNYVGGMSITPALTLGRLLGSHLAAANRCELLHSNSSPAEEPA